MISIENHTVEDVVNEYIDHILHWNKKINLVSRNHTGQALYDGVVDSVICAKKIMQYNDRAILDLGSGSGFPGIPVALFNKDKTIYLVESNSKKCSFLFYMKAQLNLSNVHIINSRVELLDMQVDCIMARAVTHIKYLMHYMELLNANKSLFIKGSDFFKEVQELSNEGAHPDIYYKKYNNKFFVEFKL